MGRESDLTRCRIVSVDQPFLTPLRPCATLILKNKNQKKNTFNSDCSVSIFSNIIVFLSKMSSCEFYTLFLLLYYYYYDYVLLNGKSILKTLDTVDEKIIETYDWVWVSFCLTVSNSFITTFGLENLSLGLCSRI